MRYTLFVMVIVTLLVFTGCTETKEVPVEVEKTVEVSAGVQQEDNSNIVGEGNVANSRADELEEEFAVSQSPTVEPTSRPATFEITDISIIPMSEGTYGATAMISNIGDESGEYTFQILLDDEPMSFTYIELDGESYQNPMAWEDIGETEVSELKNHFSTPDLWSGMSGPDGWFKYDSPEYYVWHPDKYVELDGIYYVKQIEDNQGIVKITLGPGESRYFEIYTTLLMDIWMMQSGNEYGPHTLSIDGQTATFELYPERNGYGSEVMRPIHLPKGLTIFSFWHRGYSNFIVWLIDSDGQQVQLLMNEIGTGSGDASVSLTEEGLYRLDITTDGDWRVDYSCQSSTLKEAFPTPKQSTTVTPSPEITPTISIDPASGPPGTKVTISGEGWAPGILGLVTVYFDEQIVVVIQPDDAGNIWAEFEAPSYLIAGNSYQCEASDNYDNAYIASFDVTESTLEGKLTAVSIDSKVTESNSVWWKYAWVLVVDNSKSWPVEFDAKIELLDSEGFIIDDDREFDLYIEAGEQKTFTGYILVDSSVASNVASVEASISP